MPTRATSALKQALSTRIDAMRDNSPAQNRAFLRIGMMVSARAISEARRKNIYRTGALINSIQHRIGKGYVSIGSFGVPYARFHEFGAVVPQDKLKKMRAWWFANLRSKSKAPKIKGQGNFSLRTGIVKPRPFLAPAFEASRSQIIEIISQELLRGKK